MKTLIYTFLILLIIASASGLYIKNWYEDVINNYYESDEIIDLKIEQGESINSVLQKLENKQLIKNSLAGQLFIKLENKSPSIKYGSYKIKKGTSFTEILNILEKGTLLPGISVTIKEGLRYEQISELLEKELSTTQFNSSEFNNIVLNPDGYTFSDEVMSFLEEYKPKNKPLRGFLYPDTYEFANDITALKVVDKMLLNFINKINSIDIKPTGELNSLYDALILSSVIEKEASKLDNRAEISAVFHNRLKIGMGLESDATVNFVTGKNDPGVLIEDTKIDNPYNTYLYTGLMPTPINNPRIESIESALRPAKSNYYFFFHTPTGKTFYSETFEEHQIKVINNLGTN